MLISIYLADILTALDVVGRREGRKFHRINLLPAGRILAIVFTVTCDRIPASNPDWLRVEKLVVDQVYRTKRDVMAYLWQMIGWTEFNTSGFPT
jgi:hypothetical protein